MADLNFFALSGRVTRDAEFKVTPNQIKVLSFSVATNRNKKDGENWVSSPSYFNVSVFGNRAESLHNYIKKGTPVILQGHLEVRTWEKQGEKRTNIELKIEDVTLTGSKPKDSTPTNFEEPPPVVEQAPYQVELCQPPQQELDIY